MTQPSYVLLYVDQPTASADVYARLFGCTPVERSETFALFVLDSGFKLGLWRRSGVQPPAAPAGASGAGAHTELCVALADDAEVDAWHARWCALAPALGLTLLQPPVHLDFGYNFVAADRDGHRLRVFAPSQP